MGASSSTKLGLLGSSSSFSIKNSAALLSKNVIATASSVSLSNNLSNCSSSASDLLQHRFLTTTKYLGILRAPSSSSSSSSLSLGSKDTSKVLSGIKILIGCSSFSTLPPLSLSSSSSSPFCISQRRNYKSLSAGTYSKVYHDEDSDFPGVFRVNKEYSYLLLSPEGSKIRVLTGSTPVYGEIFRNTRYAFSNSKLTFTWFWEPPSNPARKQLVVTSRPPRKNWYRLTADASLTPNRAGGGFLIRNDQMNPVCTGEIMFTSKPAADINAYEMLVLSFALKEVGTGWFPMEISSDNSYIIHLLNDDELWKLRHKPPEELLTELIRSRDSWLLKVNPQGDFNMDPDNDILLLKVYKKIILTLEALLIISGGKFSWKDVSFSSLPRECNFGADFLANTVHEAGVSFVTLPNPGADCLIRDQVPELLWEILDRDYFTGFIKFS